MEQISYQIIHRNFKLNGFQLNKEELFLVAYSFIKEGAAYEKHAGKFILDWLDSNSFIEIETSGTTGKPKSIKVDKQIMVNSALVTGSFFNLMSSDRALNCLSAKYIASKMMFVRAFVLGLELDFVEPTSNPLEKNNKCYNFVAMVPLQIANSLHHLNRIKTLLIGGAKLDYKIAHDIKTTNCDAFETYGMTETVSHIAAKKIGDDFFKLLPNITISKDHRSCLVINAQNLNIENLVTNDIVEIVSENQFKWIGRYDNVINSAGIKLFPEQIEEKLASKITKRFFVAGLYDGKLGEKLVLFVEGDSINIEESTFISLDKYEKPKEIFFIPCFEETETGKIKRKAIIESIQKNNMKSYSIQEINEVLQGEIVGQTNVRITAPEQITDAKNTEITFIGHKKYEKLWQTSNACAAVVNEDIAIDPGENKVFIKVKNADLAMSQILSLFAPPPPVFHTNIHANAVVDATASVGNGSKIGAGVYIGLNVKIGENVTIYPNATILDESTIGDNTIIWSGAVVRERCHVGKNCIIHPNATIGADGFGFRPDPEKGLVKIPQIGNVILGDYVEVGANSSIDRGKFSSTILGYGCKIDNLVQIGHNSKLGKFCIMAGNSGLAGSVTLGDGVVIGGSASIKDHTTIGDGAMVGAGSGVTADIPAGKVMLGYPAVEARDALKQWAILKRLVRDSSK